MKAVKAIMIISVLALFAIGAVVSGTAKGAAVYTVLGLMFTSYIWIPIILAVAAFSIISKMGDHTKEKPPRE